VSGYTVAILGATGMVGHEMLRTVIERRFPVAKLKLLASARTAGSTVSFAGVDYAVELATPEAFEGVDLVLASAGASVSRTLAPEAVKRGAVVVDNTSEFRMDPTVPLVIPEINAHALNEHRGIVANPNCSTAILLMAVAPLRVQALNKPIAFNLIPHIDVFQDNGYTKEELKFTNETRKIFEDPEFRISGTCVRVPVAVGHAESVNIEFDRPVDMAKVREAIAHASGVRLMDDPATATYPQPTDAAGIDDVLVGRIRGDVSHPNAINLWVVGDNLRRGAALNAVLIAESLAEQGLLGPSRTLA